MDRNPLSRDAPDVLSPLSENLRFWDKHLFRCDSAAPTG